jgi:transcriptional regulator with XRE-family HTH domain
MIRPDLIRRVRRALRLSQAGLAEYLGLTPSAVAHWEAGSRRPSSAVLRQLTALLRARGLVGIASELEYAVALAEGRHWAAAEAASERSSDAPAPTGDGQQECPHPRWEPCLICPYCGRMRMLPELEALAEYLSLRREDWMDAVHDGTLRGLLAAVHDAIIRATDVQA